MKKAILLTLSLMIASITAMDAQKICYVDVNKILESSADYRKAQNDLDRIAASWRQDIAQEYDKIKSLYNKYQAEQVLMSDDMRREKEDEIMAKEKSVRELQKSKFGPEGELFRKRQELVKPIQDKVYGAIEDYAYNRGYDFVFDKAGAAGILFSNPKYDKTDDILDKLKN